MGGFDDHNKNGICELTIEGYYSPPDNSQRIACKNNPPNSSWAKARGLTTASECNWTCNFGYKDNDRDGDCEKIAIDRKPTASCGVMFDKFSFFKEKVGFFCFLKFLF